MSYIQKVELMQGRNMKFIHSSYLDVSKSIVSISEEYDTILYIVDLTTDDIIYNPLQKGRGGVVNGQSVLLNFPMSGLSDTDSILVVADINETKIIEAGIKSVEDQIRINNVHLSIITGDEIT